MVVGRALLPLLLVLGAGMAYSAPTCTEGDSWEVDCNTCYCQRGREVCTEIYCAPTCTEGDSWEVDCNTCYCQGGREVCTEIYCRGKRSVLAPGWGQQCEDGAKWRVGCNWCTCFRGKPACTGNICFPDYDATSEPDCRGTAGYKRDCNWCHCINGRSICTEKACAVGPVSPAVTQVAHVGVVSHGGVTPQVVGGRERECDDGTRWRQNCNWCNCRNGYAACTLRACLPNYDESSEAQCDGVGSWKQDCNRCNCVDGEAICTTRACDHDHEEVEISVSVVEPVCEDGVRWRQSCNWCNCNNGSAACTLRACLPNYNESVEAACEGVGRWKKDCNWCYCVEGGRGICTTRACLATSFGPQVAETSVEEPECEEGAHWRKDCNRCNCVRGKAGCTKRVCRPGYETDEPECEGVSRWRKDCNWCDCVDGVGICTTSACNGPSGPQVTETQVVEPECEEGSRWRKSCNWCSCFQGVGGCTKMVCHPGYNQTAEPECEGVSRWKNDCNWCDCVDGVGICTTRACNVVGGGQVVEIDLSVVEPEPPCEGDVSWTEGCATCDCHGGAFGCTVRPCLPNNQSSEPECDGVGRWKKHCNWCDCVDGVGICTNMTCDFLIHLPPLPVFTPVFHPDSHTDYENQITTVEVVSIAQSSCTAESVWREGCNWCVCMEGSGACTLMGCLPDFRSNEPECEGDAHWKRDCNWCSCHNGLAACSKRKCPASEVSLPNQCYLPAFEQTTTICAGFFKRWSFNANAGQCEEVVYGGCGGTANLYDTEEQCQTACPVAPRTFPTATPQNRDRCFQAEENGPCFGSFLRYRYDDTTDTGVEFPYGGCEGNDNRFDSMEECLGACQLQDQTGTAQGTPRQECDRSQCPWHRWGHYLAQDCQPIYVEGVCCPTSFDCPSNSSTEGGCEYKGRVYQVGEDVPVDNPCSAGCRCGRPRLPNMPSEIVCAEVECPSVFHAPDPNCRPIYSIGSCCRTSEDCVEPGAIQDLRATEMCRYGNKTYEDGDRMYFPDLPCRQCICTPGYTDPYGPGCSEVNCGWDFRYAGRYADGCTPVFFKDQCCPIKWLCPDTVGEDGVSSPPPSQPDSANSASNKGECTLGASAVKGVVGQRAETENCELDCRCITPPSFTCVQDQCQSHAEKAAACGPPPECGSDCTTVTDPTTDCLNCVCPPSSSFSCPPVSCQDNCYQELNQQTGCMVCKCDCNYDSFGVPPCPHPSECLVHVTTNDTTGCDVCECLPQADHCSVDYAGRAHCPMDCAIYRFRDSQTGCEVCECDPNNPGSPWDPIPPRNPNCPLDPSGRAPCPMDCAIIRRNDPETGCEVCECDPNNPDSPWSHLPPRNPNCPLDPTGRAPCPMDCAIIRRNDPETGCEVCECDPNNPGSPWSHLPHQNPNCPLDPSGRAPCPMDCAIIRRNDPETGCEVCECDPNNPGSPWRHLPPQNPNCAVDPTKCR